MFRLLKSILSKPYLALLATLIVCFLLFSPSKNLNVDVPFFLSDKVAHALAFAGLTFLWMQYFNILNKTILFIVVFAVITEVVQYLLPVSFKRSFEIADLGADFTGLIIGLACSKLYYSLISKT